MVTETIAESETPVVTKKTVTSDAPIAISTIFIIVSTPLLTTSKATIQANDCFSTTEHHKDILYIFGLAYFFIAGIVTF